MTSARYEPFLQPLGVDLRKRGFEGRGPTWVRRHESSTDLINLQRSEFSAKFYLNIGLFVHSLGPPPKLLAQFCHLRVRAPYPRPRPDKIEEALDLESDPETAEIRISRVLDYLAANVIPLFDRWSDIGALREDLRRGRLRSAAIVVPLQRLLDPRAA